MANSSRTPGAADHVEATDHVLGEPDARVAIVEYGDFECPMCAQAAPALGIIKGHFGDDVCLVFRHYPLVSVHPHAMMAAEAAEAAAAQGRFWPMHDALFRYELHLGRERMLYCGQLCGLDMARFEHEMDGRVHRARVEADIAAARALHVVSTPAIFVNGEAYDVSFGMERLRRHVEDLLATPP